MMSSIKTIFDTYGKAIKFDRTLLKEITRYGTNFVNSSEDHISFFGGNSIGVYPVKFKPSDRHEFLIDILDFDEVVIRNEVKSLEHIDDDWVRGTDVMNLSCLWLAHRFKISSLGAKEKHDAMFQCMLILNYKFITSLMSHFFPHPVNPELSQMVYDELSMKFTLKKEGSWMGLMKERAEDIISEKGIHADTLTHFNNDADIQYMITDIQGRLRSIIKNLWEVLADIMRRDMKRHKLSYFSELEGEVVIKDMSKKYSTYRDYIEKVVASPVNEFIKPELIQVIGDLIPTMPTPLLSSALVVYHNEYAKKNKVVREWFDTIIVHCFEHVLADPATSKKASNIPELLVYMKSLYMASKSKGDVEKMRNLGEKFIKKNVKNNNNSVIAAVRTGIMLYIVLRMFSKDYYG